MKYLLIIACTLCVSCSNIENDAEKLRSFLDDMEEAYAGQDMLKVASYFTDEGVLMGSNGLRARGRKAIDEYWSRIQEPISWTIEDLGTYESLAALENSRPYQTMQARPAIWDEQKYPLAKGRDHLYQLCKSKLIRKNNGVEFEVFGNAIMVWQKGGSENWKVAIESYTRATAE